MTFGKLPLIKLSLFIKLILGDTSSIEAAVIRHNELLSVGNIFGCFYTICYTKRKIFDRKCSYVPVSSQPGTEKQDHMCFTKISLIFNSPLCMNTNKVIHVTSV